MSLDPIKYLEQKKKNDLLAHIGAWSQALPTSTVSKEDPKPCNLADTNKINEKKSTHR
ncbi:hypothetical protein AK830_g3549 [Neonectria ditissima]|uniref:Uncharacterized protein n=1 Tax=Neonectria ditissima TaxID=78410 RepID=A0A0P7BHT6_9HYPO|nr:hypothetical protein AK830_g3549 [Neonectria ditissima]